MLRLVYWGWAVDETAPQQTVSKVCNMNMRVGSNTAGAICNVNSGVRFCSTHEISRLHVSRIMNSRSLLLFFFFFSCYVAKQAHFIIYTLHCDAVHCAKQYNIFVISGWKFASPSIYR